MGRTAHREGCDVTHYDRSSSWRAWHVSARFLSGWRSRGAGQWCRPTAGKKPGTDVPGSPRRRGRLARLLPCLALLALPALALAQDAPKPPDKPPYETRADHDPDGTGKFYLGREIAQVMGFQGARWLERSEREQEEAPAKLLEALAIKPGETVADFGAGSGYYTLKFASAVGETGKVYAADVQPEMIRLLKKRAGEAKLKTIEPVLCTERDPKLPANSCDLIVMVDVYHELLYPREVAEKLVAALKPGGRLVFVEFRLEDPKVPIKLVHKMSERQVIREMAEFPQLEHLRTVGTLPWQHVVVFAKRAQHAK